MKTCSSMFECEYKAMGASIYNRCNYNGYCDFQLPRDSRPVQQSGTGKCVCGSTVNTGGICPMCGLPIA